MVDPSGKGSEAEDTNNRNPNGEEGPINELQKKTCADCGTSKTPLWRGGPAGPKSLCNACGIRSRKKKRVLGTSKGSNEDHKKGKRSSHGCGSSGHKLGDSLKQRVLALGREVLMQRYPFEKQRKKLGEEEQAAVVLMSLSYGSVSA